MTSILGNVVRDLNKSYNLIRHVSSYKSAISLDTLYPNSSLKLTTPGAPRSTSGAFNGYIPIEELEISYSRSSGPGGQNVNKVNTKVDVRFNLQSAKWLDNETKIKLADKFKNKLTVDGCLIFRSDLTRYQQMNLADCLEKIRVAVRSVSEKEPTQKPETEERIRKRFEKAARERLIEKRQRTEIKASRREPTVAQL